MKILKNIVLYGMVFFAVCIVCSQEVKAVSVEVERSGFLKEAVPDEIYKELEENGATIIEENIRDSEDIYALLNDTKLTIGKANICWNASEGEVFYEFPVISQERIIAILEVTGESKDRTYSLRNDLSYCNKLNEIQYLQSDYVIYSYQAVLYAESESEQYVLEDDSHLLPDTIDKEYKEKEDDFYNADFQTKKELVVKKVLQTEEGKKAAWYIVLWVVGIGAFFGIVGGIYELKRRRV